MTYPRTSFHAHCQNGTRGQTCDRHSGTLRNACLKSGSVTRTVLQFVHMILPPAPSLTRITFCPIALWPLFRLPAYTVALLLLVTLVTPLMVGCPKSVPYVPPPQLGKVSLSPNDWSILYSYNMPAHPLPFAGGAWEIPLPGPTANLQYMQVPFTASGTPAEITVTFKVESASAIYNGKIDPACSDPATFHLFIERRGDNGTQDFYRWWYDGAAYVFGQGDNQTHTITAPMTYDQWSSVFGHHDAAQFAATLLSLNAVGLTFGGTGGCWGHGMDVLSGGAQFDLINYEVNDTVAIAPPPPPVKAIEPTCAEYLACRYDTLMRNIGASWCNYYVPEWNIVYDGKIIGSAISCTPDGSGEKAPVI